MRLNMAVASLVNGALKSPEEMQAFNAEDYFTQKYIQELNHIRQANIRQSMTIETINTVNGLPTFLAEVFFLGLAILSIVLHHGAAVQAGYIIAILMIVPQIMGPVQGISSYLVMLRSTWPSVRTVLSHLDPPLEAAGSIRDEVVGELSSTLARVS